MTALRARQPDFPVAFVPVSTRFNTNLESVTFGALATQLARLLGEEVPADPNTPGQIWRSMVSGYLRRPAPQGRLLVILDGVDEAASWDVDGSLFPLDPPPGLKILVSARLTAHRPRPEDWQRALAWERHNPYRLELPALDRPGLRDVLEKMGVPLDELARQPFIVEELHRLTGGDPLLVNLHVSDLWQKGEAVRRLRPEDLRSLRPDYEGYFDRWWEDQRRLWGSQQPLREKAVRELLNLLSAALGPLRAEDLLRLADPALGLDSWMLEESLRPLARFVVQSGQGYVFAHPRLAEYFWNKLTAAEREGLERRFREWGGRVLSDLGEGRLPPRDAPPYLVRYYCAHLERAAAPLAEFRPLVETRAWAEAWEALEGSFGGYLGDVQAFWQRVAAENRRAAEENQPAPHLGDEIRCALIEASLHSLAANLPPQLPALLVQHGLWTPRQALTYICQNPDEWQRAEAFEKLLPFLPPELLPEALAAAREIEDVGARARVLTALAARLPPELLPEALSAGREIKYAEDRARVLTALAERLPTELLPEALAAAREIKYAEDRARVLTALAERLPEVWPEALAAAREIKDANARAKVLTALAERLPEVWPETLAAAKEIKDANARAKVLTALAERLPPELLPEALAAAREIKDSGARIDALTALAERLPQVWPETLAAAREIKDTYARADALTRLVGHFPEVMPEILAVDGIPPDIYASMLITVAKRLPAELLSQVLDATRKLPYSFESDRPFADALTALAACLPPKLLSEALAVARELEDVHDRARVLAALAERFPEVLPEALAAARKIGYGEWRAEALAALAKRLPPELLPEALAAAREIKGEWSRARTLIALAERLPLEMLPKALAAAREIKNAYACAEVLALLVVRFPETLPEALAFTRKIKHASARARLLTALAERLPPELLPEALAAAREIKDSGARADVLTALAKRLPPELLSEALASTREIEVEWRRARALAALAERLPPELLPEALAAAREINDSGARADVLTALAKRLPPELLPEALAAAREIVSEWYRADVLTALAEHLPELLPEALAAAREIEDEDDRARLLPVLSPRLAELSRRAL
jgi:hypothetical protein